MTVASINQNIISFFIDKMKAGRLAHAYLLIAPQGAGKLATALEIAKLVNCQAVDKTICGICSSCVKIQTGQHPDVMMTATGEESIKIADVKALLSKSQLTAYEGLYKVFIIANAQHMTTDAANAFLKTLEEPAKETLIILTTSQPQAVLATITSRCQWVRFPPQRLSTVEEDLRKEGVGEIQSHYLAHWAGGWKPLAWKLWQDGFYARKQDIAAAFLNHGLSDEHIKLWADDHASAREALDVCLSLIRDAFIFQATGNENIFLNSDHRKEIKILAQRSSDDLETILNQIKQIKHQINEQLNPKMALGLLKEYIWNPSYK